MLCSQVNMYFKFASSFPSGTQWKGTIRTEAVNSELKRCLKKCSVQDVREHCSPALSPLPHLCTFRDLEDLLVN